MGVSKAESDSLQVCFKNHIFDTASQKLEKLLQGIGYTNSLLNDTECQKFTYRGVYYKSSLSPHTYYPAPKLHPSLEDRFNHLICLSKEILLEQEELRLLIGYGITYSSNMIDVVALFPSALRPPGFGYEHQKHRMSLTEADIQTFRQVHDETFQKLAERLIWNITG